MSIRPSTNAILTVTVAAATLAGASIAHAQQATATPNPIVPTVSPSNVTAVPNVGPRLEIDGAIVAINGTQMLVGGIPIDISRAQISRTLTTGQLVHVEAVLMNGSWLALEVDAERFANNRINNGIIAAGTVVPLTPAATLLPSAMGREVELHGVITLIEPGFITIGGQRIDISRAELNLPSMGIGTIVKVHVSGMPGAYVAREVELIDEDDLDEAEMAAVLAGGLVIDFDLDSDDSSDDSSGNSSTNTSNNTSTNSSDDSSSNSSTNTSSNSSTNTSSNSSTNTSSNSSSDSHHDDDDDNDSSDNN